MLLPNLDIYSFEFTVEFLQDGKLPAFKGNLLRSAFATSFRDVVCHTGAKTCDKCMLKSECHYFRLFETELPDNHFWFLKGIKKIPHSIIIQCTDFKTLYQKGKTLKITINIVGDDVKKIPFIIYSLIIAGQKGIGKNRVKYLLSEVDNKTFSDNKTIFNKKSGLFEESYNKIIINDDSNINQEIFTIEFLTPVRLQAGGKEILSAGKFTPALFINNLYRRYLALANIYFNSESDYKVFPKKIDTFLEIIKSSLIFKNLLRYSYRQKDVIPLGGLLGCVTFKGDVREYYKLLKTGEYIGSGKNTIFGLGTYIIITEI